MKERTKDFALEVVRLYSSLPRSVVAQTLGRQVLRSGTSVGAHYREAVRSRSDAEYISKHENRKTRIFSHEDTKSRKGGVSFVSWFLGFVLSWPVPVH